MKMVAYYAMVALNGGGGMAGRVIDFLVVEWLRDG